MRHLLIVLALAIAGCGGAMPPTGGNGTVGDDGGLAPFGAPCAAGSECDSGVCFIGGNRTFCSLHCTTASAATDCPVPPTSGTCNMQGYCKP